MRGPSSGLLGLGLHGVELRDQALSTEAGLREQAGAEAFRQEEALPGSAAPPVSRRHVRHGRGSGPETLWRRHVP